MVFSGTAFVVAMFGMLLVPSSIMRSLAVGAIVVGIVSVVAATTLLPACSACWETVWIRCGSHSSVAASSSPRVPRVASGAGSCGACYAGQGSAWCCRRACSWCWRPRPRLERGYERRLGSPRPLRLEAGLARARARLPGSEH